MSWLPKLVNDKHTIYIAQEANARNLIHVLPNQITWVLSMLRNIARNCHERCSSHHMCIVFVWRLKVLKSQGQHNSDIQPLANAMANKLSPEKQDTLTNIQSTLIETNNVRFMNLFKQWNMTILYNTTKMEKWNKFRLCGGILSDKHSLMCVILKTMWSVHVWK
jgi:hypothetical protein